MIGLSAVAALALRLLAQVGVAVSAPSEVAARDPVLVTVEVTTPAGREVRVEAPSFAPFRLLRATRFASVDSAPAGRRATVGRWQVVEFRYVIAPPPNAAGRYAFDGFVARSSAPGLREAVAKSRSWEVAVRGAPPPPPAPSIVARVRPQPRAGISFHALVSPETVYVGQQATYQVAVFLDDDVRTRLRRNPEFLPPELRSMLAYDLSAGRASLRNHVVGGRAYDVHVFQRAVFPLVPGAIAIPPAQLTYSLPLSSGFFSREESYTARTEPTRVVAIEPPREGRPASWNGAVGALTATARVDTTAARVGDAIVFTLRVEGAGNVKLLPRPALAIPWAAAVPSTERVSVDSLAVTVRGAKEFDWILTPRDTGARETPAVEYAYFDPYERRYETATARPVALTILPGALALAAGDSAGGPPLPIRATYRGAAAPPLPSRPLFWALLALVPLPAAAVMVRSRPRRPARPRSALQQLDALARPPRRSGPAADVRDVRRWLVAALTERLALAIDVAAGRGLLARALRRRGITADAAADAESLLAALDAEAYAGTASGARTDGRDAARRARALYDRLDAEACGRETIVAGRAAAAPAERPPAAPRARPLGRGGARGRAVVLLVAGLGASGVGAAVGHAARADDAATSFALGVRAYGERRFAAAQRAFGAAAAAEPRAPDAWANAGTAAWAAGDTLTAAIGWQRALRLEPRAGDVRARMTLLPTAQGGPIAGVLPIVPDHLLAAAAALWAAGWIAAAVAAHRRRGGAARAPGLGRAASGSLVAAAVAGVAGIALAESQRADQVAVVRFADRLHDEPVLGAETGAPVEPTDVARLGTRRGAWTRVELDGGRAGWLAHDRLVPLAGADAGP